jgi:hypothetical protein
MHTFIVNNNEIVERFRENTPEIKPFIEHASWKDLPGETVYASEIQTIKGSAPFFHTISYAFNYHFPLELTPDSVWLTILSGLVHYIDREPERLRHHFVQHEGKLMLEFRTNSPSLPNVSAETMGAMKHYFTYKMMFVCGLNKVTILGTPDDWADIGNRVNTLNEFGLKSWTEYLAPVIEQIQRACEGKPDIDFWRRIYLRHGYGSGGQYNVSGWVNVFYPFIPGKNGMITNPFKDWEQTSEAHKGNNPSDFSSGLVHAPVILDDWGTIYDFKFYGGLVGVHFTPETFAVRPVSGWAIQNLGLAQKK